MSAPSHSARMSVGRNGAEAGIEKTRGIAMRNHTRIEVATGFAALRYAALARIAASAALMELGVPTCIQRPSRRRPNNRPASAARVKKGDMEEGPGDAPARNAGVRIAAPA